MRLIGQVVEVVAHALGHRPIDSEQAWDQRDNGFNWQQDYPVSLARTNRQVIEAIERQNERVVPGPNQRVHSWTGPTYAINDPDVQAAVERQRQRS